MFSFVFSLLVFVVLLILINDFAKSNSPSLSPKSARQSALMMHNFLASFNEISFSQTLDISHQMLPLVLAALFCFILSHHTGLRPSSEHSDAPNTEVH